MKILCDIGGTHARFAFEKNGNVEGIRKYRAADFERFEDALFAYCGEEGGSLRIATAAYEEGSVWRFVNQNKWVIDPAALDAAGWHVEMVLNDFAAAVWGLLGLKDEEREVLNAGAGSDLPRCLIGPGTGLGLGYLTPLAGGGYHVQRTHGGHMPAAAHTDEQASVLAKLRAMKGGKIVFEHVVSGQGLHNIYSALAGSAAVIQKPEGLLEDLNAPFVKDTLRLFHEFFGLFAQTVVVSGHAYGGLYLTGGVLDILAARGLFDYARFAEFLILPGVDSVTQDLARTPVVRVLEPYLALRGLLHA